MMRTRRQMLKGFGAAALSGAIGLGTGLSAGLGAGPAWALDAAAAKAHVQSSVDEVLALMAAGGDSGGRAERFRAILENRAAMPQIARFAAGRVWREMSADQQARYSDAFAHYISTVYARRFQEYSGQAVQLGAVSDQGKRGLSVASLVDGPNQTKVKVDWLVSDRPGRTVIADIVIEGVSLLISQREEIAAIYTREGSTPDGLIQYLEGI
ncbi:MAG: ABC transporter substrate-binding protein [Pseudomonadota bacterium]